MTVPFMSLLRPMAISGVSPRPTVCGRSGSTTIFGSDGQSQQIQVSGPTIDDGRDERHPSRAAAMIIGVSSGCHRRHRPSAVDVHDAVDNLVVDAIAADRNDQRSPAACRGMSQLAGVTWVASRLEGDSAGQVIADEDHRARSPQELAGYEDSPGCRQEQSGRRAPVHGQPLNMIRSRPTASLSQTCPQPIEEVEHTSGCMSHPPIHPGHQHDRARRPLLGGWSRTGG